MNALAVRVAPVVRFAFAAWTQPLAISGGCHWASGPEPPATLPLVVAQLTGPGEAVRYIGGDEGWSGELMVRCVAPYLADAEALAAAVAGVIPERAIPLSAPDLVLTTAIARPLPSIIGTYNAQAGFYVRLTLNTL